ncbi:hypothetical protein VNI00_010368 [Paramarasmius palmivorus]|uniref:F-box domain-containing protein n=1 Tax=Paramarasmius palmivorus TaxID=297713 RepID=A0AAW0CKG6_9AGAR
MPNSQIPPEIWLRIAGYLSKEELLRMLGLNRVFFHLAMDEQYRELSLFELGSPELLTHLGSPFVAPRIRLLRIQATPTHDLAYSPQLLEDFFCLLLHLQECHIVWYDLPLLHDPVMPRLLQTAISTSSSLRTLSLVMSLEKMAALLNPNLHLPSLEVLDLSICYESPHSASDPSVIMERCIAPFVHRTSDTLTSFAFETSHPMDYSPFFATLRLPCLRALSLSIPGVAPYLGDYRSIKSFFDQHSGQLEELTLRGTYTEGAGAEPGTLSEQNEPSSQKSWVQACFKGAAGNRNLRSLNIQTSFLPLEVIGTSIQRFSSRLLTTLVVTGRHLSFALLETTLSSGFESLEKLKLGTVTLSPELVDLIAGNTPNLQELDIQIRHVVSSRHIVPMYASKRMRRMKCQVREQIDDFIIGMRNRRYDSWAHLRRVGVWKFALKMRLEKEYVKVLQECLPSLRH